MIFYNNPCYDVHFFIYSSLRTESFERIPELLRIYYESLAKNLKLLEYDDIPTFEYIEESFNKLNTYGLQVAISFRPIVTGLYPMSKLKEMYPDDFEKYFTYACVHYGGDGILKAVQESLKYFKKIGVLK
uniref:Unkown protein n=1 Tax=Riptortus pedestris TaxID=329032 RepID=R4WPG3_RIPPE|nr:unkown protein [Riptortus pedestris]